MTQAFAIFIPPFDAYVWDLVLVMEAAGQKVVFTKDPDKAKLFDTIGDAVDFVQKAEIPLQLHPIMVVI